MKKECTKCGTDSNVPGSYYVEGGELFYFCKLCSIVLDELPPGNVHFYLGDDGIDKIKSSVTKNIILVRLRRKKLALEKVATFPDMIDNPRS
jgi:hypothetical protein